ncbi:MAG: hypothetical protein V7K53_05150 [Nostoc sp.]|uniref:hypothetical protein n=1 Tax=Nostoc sp. TaxID=1180 RepID=UPI002FFBF7B7
MPEEPISDQFLIQLLEAYTSTEAAEIQQYISEWDAATYTSVAQSILYQFNMKLHIIEGSKLDKFEYS